MKAALTLTLALAAGPALATGDIFCEAPDGSAEVHLGVGHVSVLAIFSARLEAGGNAWATTPMADETEIIVGQAYRDAAGMAVDFTDPNVERIVAEIRTFLASEESTFVETGWLRVPGTGVWPLLCEGN